MKYSTAATMSGGFVSKDNIGRPVDRAGQVRCLCTDRRGRCRVLMNPYTSDGIPRAVCWECEIRDHGRPCSSPFHGAKPREA